MIATPGELRDRRHPARGHPQALVDSRERLVIGRSVTMRSRFPREGVPRACGRAIHVRYERGRVDRQGQWRAPAHAGSGLARAHSTFSQADSAGSIPVTRSPTRAQLTALPPAGPPAFGFGRARRAPTCHSARRYQHAGSPVVGAVVAVLSGFAVLVEDGPIRFIRSRRKEAPLAAGSRFPLCRGSSRPAPALGCDLSGAIPEEWVRKPGLDDRSSNGVLHSPAPS